MYISDWQRMVALTARYPGQGTELGLFYTVLGLTGEAGEVADQVKKAIRDEEFTDDRREKIFYELGDLTWYAMRVCEEMGWNMEDVLSANYNKLRKRYEKASD